jgi:hypothetical protein
MRRLVSMCHALILYEITMKLLLFISNQSGDTLRAGGDRREQSGKLKSQKPRFGALDVAKWR